MKGATIGGNPTFRANVLQIVASKAVFDRQHGADDPPLVFWFESVNSLLARLRSVGRSPILHAITHQSTFYVIEYLDDNGVLLPKDETKTRRRFSAFFSDKVSWLTNDAWQAVASIPTTEFQLKPWEALLLDAIDLLPDSVPAVVLCAAALEVLIEDALKVLAPTDRISELLRDFINDRGDYRKEPSVEEEFDSLLFALTGESLKSNNTLWEAFKASERCAEITSFILVVLARGKPKKTLIPLSA